MLRYLDTIQSNTALQVSRKPSRQKAFFSRKINERARTRELNALILNINILIAPITCRSGERISVAFIYPNPPDPELRVLFQRLPCTSGAERTRAF